MPVNVYSSTASSSSAVLTGNNRTRAQAIVELLNYIGGDDSPDAQARAGRAWDAAVREFNRYAWVFNRVYQDLALPSDFDSAGEGSVETDFRSPLRAQLLDSNSKPQEWVDYIPWREWTVRRPSELANTAPSPYNYTLRNVHATLKVILTPPPATVTTYTTFRLHYHRRILLASSDLSQLNVPAEVDEAIFQLALANTISMLQGHDKATGALARALDLRLDIERDWRDFQDTELLG